LRLISTFSTLNLVETDTLDAIDQQILHLLTIEPRAPFRTIARVTGISDQTAARRYRRLAETAGLRVLGVADGSALGWTDWFVRLQTTPGGADGLAEALARRPDTKWVHLTSGGTEVLCFLEARTAEQRDALFLHGLPGSRRVVQITAYSVVHNYTPFPWRGIRQALSPGQLDSLAPAPAAAPGPASVPALSLPADEPLLTELGRDGRASNAAIAAAIHWHESTVRRRIDELRRSGVLHFEIDLDSSAVGMHVHGVLWLSIEPACLDQAGQLLAGQLEIPFAAATTGPTNLVASAHFRDTRHLYEYLTGALARLPGLRSVETAPIIRTLKRTGAVA
jgi:DNA-binding Lrp family transcriptional regulator